MSLNASHFPIRLKLQSDERARYPWTRVATGVEIWGTIYCTMEFCMLTHNPIPTPNVTIMSFFIRLTCPRIDHSSPMPMPNAMEIPLAFVRAK